MNKRQTKKRIKNFKKHFPLLAILVDNCVLDNQRGEYYPKIKFKKFKKHINSIAEIERVFKEVM